MMVDMDRSILRFQLYLMANIFVFGYKVGPHEVTYQGDRGRKVGALEVTYGGDSLGNVGQAS